MKLTIILTVYNKEQYLRRAMHALLNQINADTDVYEVLAVNDGSTDGSAAILEEYANRDTRVRILTQHNQGLSMARNNGVEAASGQYVWFVDADDAISLNAVNLICNAIKSNPDVIPIYAQTEGIDKVRNAVKPDAKTGKDIIVNGNWAVCGVFNVFKKEFLKENNLRFIPGIYHEDAEFTPRVLYTAKTVKVVPEILYTVYRDPNSITQVPRPKRAFDYLIVTESLSEFVVDNNEEGTTLGRSIDDCTAQFINNAFGIIRRNDKISQQQFEKDFYKKRKKLLRVLKSASKLKYKIEAFWIGLFPKHCISVYKIMRRFE